MIIPSKFDDIRPYEPEELAAVYERLLSDPQFKQVLAYVMPGVPFEVISEKMYACKTNVEFQKVFCYHFLQNLLAKYSKGCDIDASAIDKKARYTFISNHRDIVLDSALLAKLLLEAGFETTCEIAIGDNLMTIPWVNDIVKVNKAFKVERNLMSSQRLQSAMILSEYIHFAINTKKENVWIAQRDGRCKDSDDRTQQAVLKMLSFGAEGTYKEKLKDLNIVPLSISYEFDPCDYLKAREFQLKRDVEGWKKSAEDDITSMKVGIMGYKGHIHYHCAPCLNGFIDSLDDNISKAELFKAVAEKMDHDIHSLYRLYPCNYIALDMLNGKKEYFSTKYDQADYDFFINYLNGQMEKIELENKDEEYLRTIMLKIYANPAINYLAATGEE